MYDPYANLIAAARKVALELETGDPSRIIQRRYILKAVLAVAIRNAELAQSKKEEAA